MMDLAKYVDLIHDYISTAVITDFDSIADIDDIDKLHDTYVLSLKNYGVIERSDPDNVNGHIHELLESPEYDTIFIKSFPEMTPVIDDLRDKNDYQGIDRVMSSRIAQDFNFWQLAEDVFIDAYGFLK